MMKRALACTLFSLFVVGTASAEPIKPIAAPIRVQPVPSLKVPLPVIPLCAIDPAATAVDFAVVARSATSRFEGRVRITGKVKNVGRSAFESHAGQQAVQLWETAPGARPRLVASVPFVNLAPNQEISVSFDRTWNSSSPAEGEFAPSYKVMLSYDPDIFIDGNTKNDDCNSRNNVKERSGVDINAMLR